MSVGVVFKAYVERSLERIPVLEVTHEEEHEGRAFVFTQIIHRNVFTEFDRKLSRHLAATRGAGFPDYTVAVEVAERGGAAPPHPLAQAHYASAPHALKGIAERALGEGASAQLTIHHNDPGAGDRGAGTGRVVTADDIEALEAGLGICRYLGETEFLSISGDFDIVLAGPPGELRPVIMHLRNGSITMPCPSGISITPFECPLHGFAGHVCESLPAQGYMAQAGLGRLDRGGRRGGSLHPAVHGGPGRGRVRANAARSGEAGEIARAVAGAGRRRPPHCDLVHWAPWPSAPRSPAFQQPRKTAPEA
jgi:hypothetical protein